MMRWRHKLALSVLDFKGYGRKRPDKFSEFPKAGIFKGYYRSWPNYYFFKIFYKVLWFISTGESFKNIENYAKTLTNWEGEVEYGAEE